MKHIIFIILAMLLIFGVQTVQAGKKQEKAVAVFTVSPRMSCQNCENKIKSNIRFESGVSEISTDLTNQTVTVKYNPAKTNIEKLKKAFAGIGYTATECVAPQECAPDSCCGKCCPGK